MRRALLAVAAVLFVACGHSNTDSIIVTKKVQGKTYICFRQDHWWGSSYDCSCEGTR